MRARLDTCAGQDQSFGDQLSGLRAAFFRDHHGIGWGGKNRMNECDDSAYTKQQRESWATFQGERHKKKWCVLVWAEKNRQNLLSTISECSNPISYLLLSQKISNQKTPNHYNLCVNKYIKYPGSVKSRSPRKKASSFLFYFSRRQKHSFCPDQWLNILEKYIWFDTLNFLWGTCC